MYKILGIILASFICISVNANNFFDVEWSEFCPKKYANINPDEVYLTSEGRYWANRRALFEKRLAKCNSLPSETQGACFASLREIETQASQHHSTDKSGKALRYLMLRSLY